MHSKRTHLTGLATGSGLVALYLLGVAAAYGQAAAGPTTLSVDSAPERRIGAYGGSLTKALREIGTREASLCIDTPAVVAGDTTVPATLALVFRKGGRIEHGAHKVRLNGPIMAGPYRIFKGKGPVTMADNAVAELLIEWWGGAADGATDNTPAFAAAMASMSHPNIKLLQGTYLGVVAASNQTVTLQGSGKSKTTLRNNAPKAHTIALSGSPVGTMISDLKVDMNGATETVVKKMR